MNKWKLTSGVLFVLVLALATALKGVVDELERFFDNLAN